MIPPAHPLPSGLVIVFEGIDGVGKTTQLKLAEEGLVAAGWPVMTTRNLGGTPIGEALRDVIKSTVPRPPMTDLYVSLAIQEALLPVIARARQEGKIILMDRGPLSLAAYQVHGTDIDPVAGWQHVEDGMSRLRPELTILYEVDTEEALHRAHEHSAGKADYFESQPLSYFQRVAEGYQQAAERYPVTTIAADQTIDAVHQQTLQAIAAVLHKN